MLSVAHIRGNLFIALSESAWWTDSRFHHGTLDISLVRDANAVLGELQRKSFDCTDSNFSLIYCCKQTNDITCSEEIFTLICFHHMYIARTGPHIEFYESIWLHTQIYLYRMPVSCWCTLMVEFSGLWAVPLKCILSHCETIIPHRCNSGSRISSWEGSNTI